MARRARIWWWTQREVWAVTIRGKRHNLGPDKKEAEKKFDYLMSLPEEVEEPEVKERVVVLLDKFLQWTQKNRAPATFDWYKMILQSFINHLPNPKILAEEIKPYHNAEWVEGKSSNTYKRNAMQAVQRAFKWSARQGYIDRSPIEYLEKPTPESRDNCPTQADYDAMMKYATEPFKSMLEFAYETGARPQEAVRMETRHIQGDMVISPANESKGGKRKRIIYLTDRAKEIIQGRPEGYVFKNRNGNQWNHAAVKCRMRNISKKTGKHFALYDIRHFFATRMLEAGLGHITVAKLMGHADATMLARVYQHIGEANDYLIEQLKRANSDS